METAQKPQLTRKQKEKGCATLLTVALFIGFYFWFTSGSEAPARPKGHTKVKALIASQQFVEQKLKAPSTAEFGYNEEAVQQLNDSTFYVMNYVDSENSFGAKLRSTYTCTITFLPGEMVNCEGLELAEN